LESIPANSASRCGLKQALGDPWVDTAQKFSVGSAIEGRVVSLTKFGAFVQVAEGIEGMVHVSDIGADKRINHPQDVLKVGQPVKAQVLEVDSEKRRLKLGMKQLLPTSIDEYIAEHQSGDVVRSRVVEVSGGSAQVELGKGIRAACSISQSPNHEDTDSAGARTDVASLSCMLAARWKSGTVGESSKLQEVRPGQVRKFSYHEGGSPSVIPGTLAAFTNAPQCCTTMCEKLLLSNCSGRPYRAAGGGLIGRPQIAALKLHLECF
jgi:small subunit ribosomal protein S1